MIPPFYARAVPLRSASGKSLNYIVAKQIELPAIAAPLYEYLLAGNGVFIRAKRPEFETQVAVSYCEVRGLPTLKPYLQYDLPFVPAELVVEMLERSRHAVDEQGQLIEIVFHLCWSGDGWQLEVPAQTQNHCRCKPVNDGPGSSYARALIEVHSHHTMPAFFSAADDADETGLRIYGVLGRISDRKRQPELRVRVGVYGNYWEVPAAWVFDMPASVVDALLVLDRKEISDD